MMHKKCVTKTEKTSVYHFLHVHFCCNEVVCKFSSFIHYPPVFFCWFILNKPVYLSTDLFLESIYFTFVVSTSYLANIAITLRARAQVLDGPPQITIYHSFYYVEVAWEANNTLNPIQ